MYKTNDTKPGSALQEFPMLRFRHLLFIGLVIGATFVVTVVWTQSNRQVALAQSPPTPAAAPTSATAPNPSVRVQAAPPATAYPADGRRTVYAYGAAPGFPGQVVATQVQPAGVAPGPVPGPPTSPNYPAAGWTTVAQYPAVPMMATPPGDPKLEELRQQYNALETQVMQAAGEFRGSSDEKQRADLRNKIKELSTQQFQLRQEWRQLEIDRLKKQLEAIEKGSQERAAKQDEVIERRIADLLQEDHELRWEPLGGSGPYYRPEYVVPAPPQAVPSYPQSSGRSPAPAQSATRYVIEVQPRPDGTTVQVPRAITEASPNAAALPLLVDAIGNVTGSGTNVPQAQLQVKFAEEKVRSLKGLFETGQLSALEMQQAQQELELAQLALAQSQQRIAAQRDLLTLSVQQARVALAAAEAALKDAEKLNQPNSIAQLQAAREKATLDIRQAETLLKLLEDSNVGPTTSRGSLRDAVQPPAASPPATSPTR